MRVPEALVNFKLYRDGSPDVLGVVDVDLPKLEKVTETIKGAAILGEYDTSIIGHTKAMDLKIKFRVINKSCTFLASEEVQQIIIRGLVQEKDTSSVKIIETGIKVIAKGVSKSIELGKLEPTKGTDTSVELNLHYLRVEADGRVLFEVDKMNFKYVVDGIDYLERARNILGI